MLFAGVCKNSKSKRKANEKQTKPWTALQLVWNCFAIGLLLLCNCFAFPDGKANAVCFRLLLHKNCKRGLLLLCNCFAFSRGPRLLFSAFAFCKTSLFMFQIMQYVARAPVVRTGPGAARFGRAQTHVLTFGAMRCQLQS